MDTPTAAPGNLAFRRLPITMHFDVSSQADGADAFADSIGQLGELRSMFAIAWRHPDLDLDTTMLVGIPLGRAPGPLTPAEFGALQAGMINAIIELVDAYRLEPALSLSMFSRNMAKITGQPAQRPTP